jgi:hypothetical protein
MRRWAPITAALLGSAALAAPAGAQAPAPAPHPPTIDITYNTSDVLLAEFPATTATLTRGGATVATGTVDGVAPDTGINSQHVFDGVGAVGCWNGFVPQILPGDRVAIGGETVAIPDITADAPVVEGEAVVVRGTAIGVNPAEIGVQLHPANAARFPGGTGSSGGQFLDSFGPNGFTSTVTFDPSGRYTARFSALGGNLALASGATAVVVWDNTAGAGVPAAGGTVITVNYEAGGVAGAAGTCTQPYAPNEAKSAGRSMINVANAGSDLSVSGVSQPGASATGITLIDTAGKSVSAPASGAGAWTGTVPAASLSSLADGPIRIASAYTIGSGATVGGLLRKDTTAPAAPTASLAAGSYTATQTVALKAAEGTVHYTTDGSSPTALSTAYSKAISVPSTQTIRAVSVDAAGNASQVAEFGYTIGAPAPIATAPLASLPKLGVESVTLTRRMSLRSARRSGIAAIIYAADGAKIARIRVLRGTRVIQALNRGVARDGVLEVRLPSRKAARRSLRRGTYRIEIQVGQSLTNLGVTKVRTIRLV